jgi:hypothetical protein
MNHLHIDPLKIELRGDVTILERLNEDNLLFIHVGSKEVFTEMMKVTITLILKGGDTVTIANAYTDLWEVLNYDVLPPNYTPTFVEELHSWIEDQITLVDLQKE